MDSATIAATWGGGLAEGGLAMLDREGAAAPAGADGHDEATRALLGCVPGLRALLLRMTRNLEITNDLAQDVLLVAWQALQAGRIREPAALPAYLHQCARHAVYAQGRRPQPVAMDELPEVESFWGERPKTPLECCEDDELRVLAQQVLADLPTERDRAVITGYYVDGEAKPELMARLGLGADHFDRVISRARGRMRELLAAKLASASRGGSSGADATPRSEP